MAFLAPLVALPWLQGFFAPTAVADQTSHETVAELAEWRAADDACVGSSYGGFALEADLAVTEGTERVLASFTQGLVVFDAERHVIAQTPGFECEGSADEIVAIAAGDGAIGVPLLAMAATTGGRTESMTWLTLYRVANSGELQPVFTGEVERHQNRTTRTGTVTLVPGGLIYRAPSGPISLWTYDTQRGRYVEEELSTRPSV